MKDLLTNKEKNEFLAKYASSRYDYIDENINNSSSNETCEEEINRGKETTEQ